MHVCRSHSSCIVLLFFFFFSPGLLKLMVLLLCCYCYLCVCLCLLPCVCVFVCICVCFRVCVCVCVVGGGFDHPAQQKIGSMEQHGMYQPQAEDRMSPGQQPPSPCMKGSQRVVTLAQHISVRPPRPHHLFRMFSLSYYCVLCLWCQTSCCRHLQRYNLGSRSSSML